MEILKSIALDYVRMMGDRRKDIQERILHAADNNDFWAVERAIHGAKYILSEGRERDVYEMLEMILILYWSLIQVSEK